MQRHSIDGFRNDISGIINLVIIYIMTISQAEKKQHFGANALGKGNNNLFLKFSADSSLLNFFRNHAVETPIYKTANPARRLFVRENTQR